MTKFLIPSLLIFGLSERLLKAPSIQKMDQIKQNEFEIKKTIHLCRQQLKKKKIPLACYQIRSVSKDLKQYLDKKCSEISPESMTLHEVSNALKDQRVSPQCLKILEEKEKILKYQRQDLFVEELFKAR